MLPSDKAHTETIHSARWWRLVSPEGVLLASVQAEKDAIETQARWERLGILVEVRPPQRRSSAK